MICTWPIFHVQMYIQVQMYKYKYMYILPTRMFKFNKENSLSKLLQYKIIAISGFIGGYAIVYSSGRWVGPWIETLVDH